MSYVVCCGVTKIDITGNVYTEKMCAGLFHVSILRQHCSSVWLVLPVSSLVQTGPPYWMDRVIVEIVYLLIISTVLEMRDMYMYTTVPVYKCT